VPWTDCCNSEPSTVVLFSFEKYDVLVPKISPVFKTDVKDTRNNNVKFESLVTSRVEASSFQAVLVVVVTVVELSPSVPACSQTPLSSNSCSQWFPC
jgi:hypothetical protein